MRPTDDRPSCERGRPIDCSASKSGRNPYMHRGGEKRASELSAHRSVAEERNLAENLAERVFKQGPRSPLDLHYVSLTKRRPSLIEGHGRREGLASSGTGSKHLGRAS